ncbi:hypothetical protein JCM10213_002625 [Rhodosporidiobolus nylandii]
MARKKPQSGKARKQQLQASRAHKKATHVPVPFPADAASPLSSSLSSSRPTTSKDDRLGQRYRTPEQRERDTLHAGRMALESRFIRLPKGVQELHRMSAATEVLPRPVPDEAGVVREEEIAPRLEGEGEEELSCPKRPKWSYMQTKKEVEKNEEGMFKKWLASTDATIARLSSPSSSLPGQDDEEGEVDPTTVRSPTFYERNLQVWRQLWRTVEQSDILLVLIDVRFPLLTYPPSLSSYLRSPLPTKSKQPTPKPLILVLTKTDLVPRAHTERWKAWFLARERERGREVEVVEMESYKVVEGREETQGTQPRFAPSTPLPLRSQLISALRRAHRSLLTPPPIVASDPERLARWNAQLGKRVRREVDWETVEAESGQTGMRDKGKGKRRPKDAPHPHARKEGQEDGEEGAEEEGEEMPYLTIGLIGHPNVGKSSLLNALLGKKVVRASRTPGKTKTLQTIYWNPTLRLCDCPGLVCPSAAGFERQVLGGLLPIQNVEPVLRFVGERVPLERVLRLRHPDGEEEEGEEDELGLGEFEEPGSKRRKVRTWTTDEILAAYADQQGFITAKVGRPDIYRAGSAILRLLHSSAIPWGFRPPPLPSSSSALLSTGENDTKEAEQEGIYFPHFLPPSARSRGQLALSPVSEDELPPSASEGEEDEEDSDEEEEEEDSADEKAVKAVRGAFAVLGVDEGESGSEEEESGDSGGEGSEEEEEEEAESE